MKTAATVALRSVPRAALSIPPAWRRRLLAAFAAAVVLSAGYWFWFRDSSFAQVKQVEVTGVAGPQARGIRSALESAALEQTTLHLSLADLRAAVADYPVVRSITAQGDFPHRLRIDVALNLPVAILQTPSGRHPVAADGLLLPDVPITPGMPVLTTQASVPAERVTAGPAYELVRVIGLAPQPLRSHVKSVGYKAGTGIVAKLDKGPDLIFGDSTRLPAKWIAAARVLAAPGARGASYVDLRLPERPAAGGLATTTVIPLAPAGEPTPVAPQTTTTPATAPSGGAATTPATTPQNPQPQVQTTPQP